MQLAVIEFARNICGLKKADSTEFDPKTKFPVIDLMEEQKKNIKERRYGGTMRLGAYRCVIKPKTISFQAYKTPEVFERHRHRYELNNRFRKDLEEKGMIIAGVNPEMDLAEIIELPLSQHPFFVGTQFHPEFKSRPLRAHPLFKEFIRKSLESKGN